MLKRLHIRNYALIHELDLDLDKGFTAITGETGSGKSILLGALGLVLGDRADTQVLFDKESKCIVEAEFDLEELPLEELFATMDLDYYTHSTFRREINLAGRSRAFVNDTPVSLAQLRSLTDTLIDIHSQHQTLLLNEEDFQLDLVEIFAQHGPRLGEYEALFKEYKSQKNQLRDLQEYISANQIDEDYLQYQLDELSEVDLESGKESELREELGLLEHAEEIKTVLNQSGGELQDEGGLLDRLNSLSHKLDSISGHTKGLEELAGRLESVRLELDDISQNVEELEGQVELDPARQQILVDQLDSLQHLLTKHKVPDVDGLMSLRIEMDSKLVTAREAATQILTLEKEISEVEKALEVKAALLTNERIKAKNKLVKQVGSSFKRLSLANAQVDVEIRPSASFLKNGMDEVTLLFNANKGGRLEPLSKVASGGELSRLMLILKNLLAKARQLPTLIFDEIDSGVSGEIASQMAGMLREISEGRQVISITHLPQVAGLAHHHLKISKSDTKDRSITDVLWLDHDGRILELAKMLSGTKISEASVANARELLGN